MKPPGPHKCFTDDTWNLTRFLAEKIGSKNFIYTISSDGSHRRGTCAIAHWDVPDNGRDDPDREGRRMTYSHGVIGAVCFHVLPPRSLT